MKTTIYELLGMIKDGKAPKKIMFDDYIYQFDNNYENYVRDDGIGTSINWDYVAIKCLNEPVKILETTITYKLDKIEKLDLSNGISVVHCAYKINEIIDRLNKEEE